MLVTGSEDGEVRLHDLSTFDTTQVSTCQMLVGQDTMCFSTSEASFWCSVVLTHLYSTTEVQVVASLYVASMLCT